MSLENNMPNEPIINDEYLDKWEEEEKSKQHEELYGTQEKIDNLKKLSTQIDFKKIPVLECYSTDHDRALPSGYYFVVSTELAEIMDQVESMQASSQGEKIKLKDGRLLPIPDNCEIFFIAGDNIEETASNYQIPEIAEMYLYIAGDQKKFEFFSKDKK
jgi:hypothetical protein